MANLSKKEIRLILWSLDQTWKEAKKKLQEYNLGEFERKAVEDTIDEAKELIYKLNGMVGDNAIPQENK